MDVKQNDVRCFPAWGLLSGNALYMTMYPTRKEAERHITDGENRKVVRLKVYAFTSTVSRAVQHDAETR